MKLGLTERQYKLVISEVVKSQEIEEQGEPVNPEPEAGTSAQQSGGKGYPAVGKWESGVTRGPANQVGVTKWSDVVGASLKRGKANQLKEQSDRLMDLRGNALLNATGIRNDKDYKQVNKTIDAASKLTLGANKVSKYVYKADDGDNLFVNLIKGEFSEALLDLRGFIFTPGGMAAQTTIELVFSETVVVPVVIEALNAAILINDWDLYKTQGDRDPEAGFRVIEDILLYITRGTFKLTGKALKNWLKTPAGAAYMRNLSANVSKYITSIKYSLNKLPNSALKRYISNKLGSFDSSLIKFLSNLTGKAVSTIPSKFRKAIVGGLLVYISATAIDKLIKVESGTTRAELAKEGGPSDEYMAKIEQISKPTISAQDIKTAEDLNILSKKGDLKRYAEQAIQLYKNGYPCLANYYKKNQFVVLASTEDMDIFKINNKEYHDTGGGIYETQTGKELVC